VIPPFIEEGIEKCLKHGIDALTIVPYFLYPGKKVKAAVNAAIVMQSKTKVKLTISKPMSLHKSMIKLVDEKIESTLTKNNVSLGKKQVDVLIIGHGSKDPNARTAIEYVADGLATQYRNVDYCFLEIEEPNIAHGIEKCVKNEPKVLIVMFYFLHEGAHVKRDIYTDLNPALEKSGLKNVFVTEHLGTDNKMIDLIIERAKEVER
ncbi:MAG: sirohydrochlorin chelatase, partial [Nitrosopumilaceae archaeon]